MAKRTAQEMFERLSDIVDDFFDPDDRDGRDSYINEHMKRAGYRPRTTWEDPEGEDSSKGDFTSNIFGSKRERREVSSPRERGRGYGMSQY